MSQGESKQSLATLLSQRLGNGTTNTTTQTSKTSDKDFDSYLSEAEKSIQEDDAPSQEEIHTAKLIGTTTMSTSVDKMHVTVDPSSTQSTTITTAPLPASNSMKELQTEQEEEDERTPTPYNDTFLYQDYSSEDDEQEGQKEGSDTQTPAKQATFGDTCSGLYLQLQRLWSEYVLEPLFMHKQKGVHAHLVELIESRYIGSWTFVSKTLDSYIDSMANQKDVNDPARVQQKIRTALLVLNHKYKCCALLMRALGRGFNEASHKKMCDLVSLLDKEEKDTETLLAPSRLYYMNEIQLTLGLYCKDSRLASRNKCISYLEFLTQKFNHSPTAPVTHAQTKNTQVAQDSQSGDKSSSSGALVRHAEGFDSIMTYCNETLENLKQWGGSLDLILANRMALDKGELYNDDSFSFDYVQFLSLEDKVRELCLSLRRMGDTRIYTDAEYRAVYRRLSNAMSEIDNLHSKAYKLANRICDSFLKQQQSARGQERADLLKKFNNAGLLVAVSTLSQKSKPNLLETAYDTQKRRELMEELVDHVAILYGRESLVSIEEDNMKSLNEIDPRCAELVSLWRERSREWHLFLRQILPLTGTGFADPGDEQKLRNFQKHVVREFLIAEKVTIKPAIHAFVTAILKSRIEAQNDRSVTDSTLESLYEMIKQELVDWLKTLSSFEQLHHSLIKPQEDKKNWEEEEEAPIQMQISTEPNKALKAPGKQEEEQEDKVVSRLLDKYKQELPSTKDVLEEYLNRQYFVSRYQAKIEQMRSLSEKQIAMATLLYSQFVSIQGKQKLPGVRSSLYKALQIKAGLNSSLACDLAKTLFVFDLVCKKYNDGHDALSEDYAQYESVAQAIETKVDSLIQTMQDAISRMQKEEERLKNARLAQPFSSSIDNEPKGVESLSGYIESVQDQNELYRELKHMFEEEKKNATIHWRKRDMIAKEALRLRMDRLLPATNIMHNKRVSHLVTTYNLGYEDYAVHQKILQFAFANIDQKLQDKKDVAFSLQQELYDCDQKMHEARSLILKIVGIASRMKRYSADSVPYKTLSKQMFQLQEETLTRVNHVEQVVKKIRDQMLEQFGISKYREGTLWRVSNLENEFEIMSMVAAADGENLDIAMDDQETHQEEVKVASLKAKDVTGPTEQPTTASILDDLDSRSPQEVLYIASTLASTLSVYNMGKAYHCLLEQDALQELDKPFKEQESISASAPFLKRFVQEPQDQEPVRTCGQVLETLFQSSVMAASQDIDYDSMFRESKGQEECKIGVVPFAGVAAAMLPSAIGSLVPALFGLLKSVAKNYPNIAKDLTRKILQAGPNLSKQLPNILQPLLSMIQLKSVKSTISKIKEKSSGVLTVDNLRAATEMLETGSNIISAGSNLFSIFGSKKEASENASVPSQQQQQQQQQQYIPMSQFNPAMHFPQSVPGTIMTMNPSAFPYYVQQQQQQQPQYPVLPNQQQQQQSLQVASSSRKYPSKKRPQKN